jgi:hypothetical protein
MPQVQLKVTAYRCSRCKRVWVPRAKKAPAVCPSCKSPYWDKPIERLTTSLAAKARGKN